MRGGANLLFYRTENAFYVYDANSNKIYQMEGEVWSDLKRGAPPPEINAYWERGFLLFENKRKFLKLNQEDLGKEIRKIRKFIIETTINCNFKCRYCPIAQNFKTINRKNRHFPQKFIPNLLRLLKEHGEDTISISFYGGEPLLNFRFIKAMIASLENDRILKKRKVRYSITTNGWLLGKEEILSFLAKKEFTLNVSLDGPQIIHDRFRRTKGGKETFEIIMKNIIKANREYERRKILKPFMIFNVVITPFTNLELLMDFFIHLERDIGEFKIMPSFVDLDGADLSIRKEILRGDVLKEQQKIIRKLKINYFQKLIYGEIQRVSELERGLFEKPFLFLYKRRVDENEINFDIPIPKSGPCIPMRENLYITTDGDLLICEKLAHFKAFGNLFEGINLKKLYEFYSAYQNFTEKYCSNCWLKRLCSLCYFHFINEKGEIDEEKQLKECGIEKEKKKRIILDYTRILEKNKNAFDFMKGYKLF